MSFEFALGMAVVRSLVISILAVFVGDRINAKISASSSKTRKVLWGFLLCPWLMPGLVIGYAWNGWPLYLSAASIWKWLPGVGTLMPGLLLRFDHLWNEGLLGCLLLARALPWSVVMLRWGSRTPESQSARFLRVIRRPVALNVWARWSQTWRDWGGWVFPRVAPSFGLAFLACFQEFELVARLGRPSWTVWLIDAQATGVELPELLIRSCIAALVQTVFLWGPLRLAFRGLRSGSSVPLMAPDSPIAGALSILLLLFGFLVTVVIPGILLLPGALEGLIALLSRRSVWTGLLRGIGVGLMVASCATLISMFALNLLAGGRTRLASRRNHAAGQCATQRTVGVWATGEWLGLLLLWLGACGAVPLGLVTVWGLARIGWSDLSQTIVPWVLVQAIWLVPRAVCVLSLIRVWADRSGTHLATLLLQSPDAARSARAFPLWWGLRWRNPALASLLLVMTAYLDLATGQLLSPPGLESAPVTLYTQMHYGRNSLLTAMTLLAVAIPWTISLLVLLALPRLLVWLRPNSPRGVSAPSR